MWYDKTNTELPSKFKDDLDSELVYEYEECIFDWDYVDDCYLDWLNYEMGTEERRVKWVEDKLRDELDEYYTCQGNDAFDTYIHEYDYALEY